MNYAYVFLLTNNSFLPGLLAAYYSLKQTKPKYPVYCLCTKAVTFVVTYNLESYGLNIIFIDESQIPPLAYQQQHDEQHIDRDTIAAFFTKLQIINLKQFDKIIYLDSDMLILKNIDHLFEYSHMSVALDTYSYYQDKNMFHMNGGLLILEPNKINYDELINFTYQSNDLGFGDESVWSQYYQINQHQELWLPLYYNTWVTEIKNLLSYYWWFNENNIYVLHYIGQKPWTITSRDWAASWAVDSQWSIWSKYTTFWIDIYNQAIDDITSKQIYLPIEKIKD